MMCLIENFDHIRQLKKHRNQTNHDQSKVSVLTKIEFDVNPLEFASDDLLQSEKEVNRNKSVIMNKNKGNFF